MREIMKNSTEMLIYLEILKQWNILYIYIIKAQSFLVGGAFMDIQNISNHSPFFYKSTQEIHDKQVPKCD